MQKVFEVQRCIAYRVRRTEHRCRRRLRSPRTRRAQNLSTPSAATAPAADSRIENVAQQPAASLIEEIAAPLPRGRTHHGGKVIGGNALAPRSHGIPLPSASRAASTDSRGHRSMSDCARPGRMPNSPHCVMPLSDKFHRQSRQFAVSFSSTPKRRRLLSVARAAAGGNKAD
jgi:hypothetical protein